MIRIYWIKIFFLIFFCAIVLRLFYWQILKADFLQANAEGQRLVNLELGALRGNIFYSDESLLVSSNPTFEMFGLPKVIPSEKKVENSYAISKVIAQEDSENQNILAKDLINKLSEDLYWVSLKKNVSSEAKKKIEKLKILGIGFDQTSNRFYPEGSSSAQFLGFVGSDARGGSVGYFGLEGYYEGELKGVRGNRILEKDAIGFPILTGKFGGSDAKDGKDLVLNIDRSVQFIVEKELKKGMEKYGAKAASSIVMDPKTGAILAMASLPTYDPAKYSDFPKELYKNPIIADQYEPGSTFKILVMGAALNEDLVTPDTICDICEGPISLGGFTIRTWNNKYYPKSNMKDVIIHSDNTGMVFVGEELGLDKLYSYIQKFGFGFPTGIDLQDEGSPELKDRNEWHEIDLATISFGQGVAVTPIQMVRAVSAIANGGNLVEPHVVKKILDRGENFEVNPKVLGQVLKEATTKIVTEMMVKAVDEGEAKFAKPKGFKIAGKTGTAQIPVAGHYDPDKTIASFVGFAPADNPRFVMLVRYDQPQTSLFGSETAAPTFFEIAKQLFTYFKIAPTE